MSETVTATGQVTIPKDVRDQLGLVPGSKVEFRRRPDGVIELARDDAAREPSRFAQFRGMLGPGLSTDEVMEMTRGDD